MILYSIRALQDAYLIAKFDPDFEVSATYEVSPSHCSCPAFLRRSSCKHQDILAKFIHRGAIDSEWFYCRETDSWHNPLGLESMPRIEVDEPAVESESAFEIGNGPETDYSAVHPSLAAPAGPSTAPLESASSTPQPALAARLVDTIPNLRRRI